MSRFISSFRIALAALVLLLSAAGKAAAQDYYGNDGQGSYQQFYDELSPYGQWVNDPQYGYVWVPEAGDDFRPYYSNGYWANTDYGNTWVSDYDWGWAPFHYGRWTYSSYYGWLWIPGNEWGPAWVSWRSGGGCYGWAPLGPGITISASFGSGYYAPDYWWTFTPQRYILDRGFRNYCYGPRYNQTYVHQTTIINNTYVNNHRTYIAGPRRGEMEHAIGRPVQQVAINNTSHPGRPQFRENSLSLYRPAISETRPQAAERPRNFTATRQPVAEPARAPREDGVQPGRSNGRSPVVQQGGTMEAPQQPVRNYPGTQQRDPRLQRPEPVSAPADPQRAAFDHQPQRQAEVQQAPPQQPRSWNSPTRNPAAMPDRRAERMPVNRGMEAPRQQPDMQPMPQRTERPMPEQRPAPVQRAEAPRMERPQQQAAPQQPARVSERPQGGGEGRRPFGR